MLVTFDLRYNAELIRKLPPATGAPMKPQPLKEWGESLNHIVDDMNGRRMSIVVSRPDCQSMKSKELVWGLELDAGVAQLDD